MTQRYPYTLPASIALPAVGIGPRQFTDAIAKGWFPCPPATVRGAERKFGIADLVTLNLYGQLIDLGLTQSQAGAVACKAIGKAVETGADDLFAIPSRHEWQIREFKGDRPVSIHVDIRQLVGRAVRWAILAPMLMTLRAQLDAALYVFAKWNQMLDEGREPVTLVYANSTGRCAFIEAEEASLLDSFSEKTRLLEMGRKVGDASGIQGPPLDMALIDLRPINDEAQSYTL